MQINWFKIDLIRQRQFFLASSTESSSWQNVVFHGINVPRTIFGITTKSSCQNLVFQGMFMGVRSEIIKF